MNKLSLITMGQGNPIALKRTLDSAKDVVDEIIFGAVCLFEDDLKLIKSYSSEYNLHIVELPFDFIFKNGFSNTLNLLSTEVTNEICVYLNVGEVIENDAEVLRKINPEYNAYYIDHATEKHRWWRMYNPKKLKWSGLIHEELVGEYNPFHKPIFRFADTEKDNNDALKSKCYDDVKELVYFNQLCKIVEDNTLLQATSIGWLVFAKEQYESMQERLKAKGKRWEAFKTGNLEMYIEDVMTNPEFEKQRFESSLLIEYQNSRRFL